MTKGSYAMGDNSNNSPRKDTSYRSFICILLIFLSICLIILLVAINWGKSSRDPSRKEDGGEVLELEGVKSTKSDEILLNKFTTSTVHYKEIEKTSRQSDKVTTIRSLEDDSEEDDADEDLHTLTTKFSSTINDAKNITASTKGVAEINDTATTTSKTSDMPLTSEHSASDASYSLTTTPKNITVDSENDITQTESSINTNFSTESVFSTTSSRKHYGTLPPQMKSEENTTVDDLVTTESSYNGTLSSQGESEENVTVDEKYNSTTLPDAVNNYSSTIPTIETTFDTTKVNISSNETQTTPSSIQLRTIYVTPSETKNMKKICRKSVCNQAASRMLSLMNHSATCCEDFYDFACGGVTNLAEEPAYSDELLASLNNMNSPKYMNNFQEFYQFCSEYENDFKYDERLQEVETLISSVGRFQFRNDTESLEYNLTDLVAELILRQSMPLFDVSVDVDKQTSNLILQLTLPEQNFLRTNLERWSGLTLHKEHCLRKYKKLTSGTFINLKTTYDSYQRCCKDYDDYISSIENLVRQFGAFRNLTSVQRRQEITDIRFNIESEIVNKTLFLSSGEILLKFVNKEYDVRKISDLQVQYPVLEWQKLFETLTGRQISGSTTIQVYFGAYFNILFESLARIEFRQLNNLFLSIYAYDLFINTVLPKEKSNRDAYCLDLSKKLMPDVWASLATSTFSPKEEEYQKKMTTELFRLLQNNMCKTFETVEWLDEPARIQFIKKCRKLNLIFFKSPADKTLEENYRNFTITENFATDLINLLVNFRRNVYSTVGKPFSAELIFSYFLDPLSRKSLSSYSNDVIAVPLGLMAKAPEGLPYYLVMTRVGLNLARQMARHFDPTGMRYWTVLQSTARASYESFLAAMRDGMDYSSPRLLHNKNISFPLNGSLSLNERIVDNAAFRLILDTYESSKKETEEELPWISSSYTNDEIFFIAAAQEFCRKTTVLDFMLEVFEKRHLPAVLRVENIMINSEAFSQKFSCGDGSGMNPPLDKFQFPYLAQSEGDYYD